MKTRLFTLLAALLAGSLLAAWLVRSDPAVAQDAPPAPNAAPDLAQLDVSGLVLNGRAGLRVQALVPGGHIAEETYLSEEGWFSLRPLPAGRYHLRVVDEAGAPLALEAASPVTVGPEPPRDPYQLVLAAPKLPEPSEGPAAVEIQANGYITGVVTAAGTGSPLEYIYVRAYNSSGYSANGDYTDSAGVYSLTLAAGVYTIQFEDNFNYDLYAPEWYANQPNRASATPVTVSAGAVTPNINAGLEVGGQIVGTLTAAGSGTPLAYASVTAYTNTNASSAVAYGSTSASGVYTLTSLPGGAYYLHFEATEYLAEYYNDKPALAAADPVSVALGEVRTGVSAALTKGAQIAGVVTAAGTGTPLASVSVYAYTSTAASSYVAYDFSDASGVYTITTLLPGAYYLRFEKTEYLAEYYNDKTTLPAADPVIVAQSEVRTGVNAALTKGAQIAGVVTAAGSGTFLADAWVYAYTSTTAAPYSYVASDYTDVNGVYTLTSLSAGTYYLRFEKIDYLSEYYDDRASLTAADPVSIAQSEVRIGVNAVLTKGAQIAGTVTAAGSGTPLQNVRVYAYASPAASLYADVADDYTDASGVYTLTTLPAGTYYLRFERAEYLTEYYNDKAALAAADPVPVTASELKTGVDAALTKGGQITGLVTAAGAGTPLAGVSVYAYASRTSSLYQSAAAAQTNASGVYTLTGLLTRAYFVRFEKTGYVAEYYNDQSELLTAGPVSVTLGSVTGGVNAALSTGGRITGIVTAGDGGQPLKDVQVTAYRCNGTVSGSALTDANGVYTITALAADSYQVYFDPPDSGAAAAYLPEYYNDKPSLGSADLVTVSGVGATSGINAVLARGGRLAGRVTAADTGLGLKQITVYVLGAQGQRSASVNVDASGVYTTPGLATGSYRLFFDPYGDSADYMAEYYNDQPDLGSATSVAVTAPDIVTGLDAVLARGGKITGTVTAGDSGLPLTGVYVYVYTATTRSRYDYLASDTTDGNGDYTIGGLATGAYYLLFDPEYGGSENYQPEYYADQASLATATGVNVAAPSTTGSVNAALIRGGSITGRVTVEGSGAPYEDVLVRAYLTPADWLAYDFSDADGQYILAGLPTGTYQVEFYDSLTFVAGCVRTTQYVYEFYNDRRSFNLADPVGVTAPGATGNINAALPLLSPPDSSGIRIYLPLVQR